MLKYKAILKKPLPEDIAERNENFEEVLRRANGSGNAKKSIVIRLLNQSPWAVAACLVVLLGGVSYAVYLLQLPTEETTNPTTAQSIKIEKESLNYSTYEIPVNEGVEIITKDSLVIEIPANTIAAYKENTGILSITDLEKLTDTAGFCVNMQFETTKDRGNVNQICISHRQFAANAKLYFGGNGSKPTKWVLAETKKMFIYKPTAAMDAYLQYVQGAALVDSIAKYYVLKKNQYVQSSKKEFTYQKNFIEQVRLAVKSYKIANSKKKILDAQDQWTLYQRQHRLAISTGTDEDKIQKYAIGKSGWYAVY